MKTQCKNHGTSLLSIHFFDIDGHSHTSTLDHFFWNEDISDNIMEANVLHIASKTSDHCSIYCNMQQNAEFLYYQYLKIYLSV